MENYKISTPEKEKNTPILETSIKRLKDVFEKIKSNKIARRIVKTFELFAVVVALDYVATRYEVTEKKSGDQIEYTHEDGRTNHYLNIMSGVDTFEQRDINMYSISIFQAFSKEFNLKSNLTENSSEAELLEWLHLHKQEMFKAMNLPDEEDETPEKMLGDLESDVISSQEQYKEFFENVDDKKSFYNAVWQIEKECGNPKIRFIPEEKLGLPGFPYNTHYNPATNTIYINPTELVFEIDTKKDSSTKVITGINSSFLSEVSHGKQFTNPIQWIDCCSDIVKAFSKAGFNCQKAYRFMRDNPGFYEYEAHEEIEPTFGEKLLPYMAKDIKNQKK